MYKHVKFITLLMIGSLLIVSCGKDSDDPIDIIDNIPEPIEKVFATIYGQVSNEEGDYIQDASIQMDDEETQTDENGFFKVTGYFNKEGASMVVSKNGYFDGRGFVTPYVDADVRTQITLVRKDGSQDGDSNSNLEYSDSNVNVAFEPNSFIDQNGKYDGLVTIFATSSLPSQTNYSKVYPGDKYSQIQNGKRIIQSYGILNLELVGSSNETLDIDGTAEISMKIDDGLQNSAPETVSLYYKDNETGFWIEDGQATRSGDTYVGQVTHFTTWCIGIDWDFYTISGIVTRLGVPIPDAAMGLNYGIFRSEFFASSDGSYSRNLVVNENYTSTITLDVEDRCDVVLESVDIPYPTDDIVQNIDVTQTANSFTVSGQIVCDSTGDNVEGAYVLVRFNNSNRFEIFLADDSGNYSFNYDDCNSQNIIVKAYDPATSSISEEVNVNNSTAGLELDICKTVITSYMTIEVDGEAPYTIPGCFVQIDDPWSGLFSSDRYTFTSIDNFVNDPNGSGEFVNYKMELTVDDNVGGAPRGPQGPPVDPPAYGEASSNPPFHYSWYPFGTITYEDAVTVRFESKDDIGLKKWVNGVETDVEGKIIIEAIKQ